MPDLTLTTPALLFSAISLIMLAYTNRFLAYAALVRNLVERYEKGHETEYLFQIKNLRKRLNLTRAMQIFGISSLLLCVLTMLLIYVNIYQIAVYIFGLALILLIASLGFLIWEIQISTKALNFHLTKLQDKQSEV